MVKRKKKKTKRWHTTKKKGRKNSTGSFHWKKVSK